MRRKTSDTIVVNTQKLHTYKLVVKVFHTINPTITSQKRCRKWVVLNFLETDSSRCNDTGDESPYIITSSKLHFFPKKFFSILNPAISTCQNKCCENGFTSIFSKMVGVNPVTFVNFVHSHIRPTIWYTQLMCDPNRC